MLAWSRLYSSPSQSYIDELTLLHMNELYALMYWNLGLGPLPILIHYIVNCKLTRTWLKVLRYEFSNPGDQYEGQISDGLKTYKLMYGSSGSSATQCTCYNGRLSCDAVTILGQWAGPLVGPCACITLARRTKVIDGL